MPVRFLEHCRFRLADPEETTGAGQGKGEPGDTLRRDGQGDGPFPGTGGSQNGGYQFVVGLDYVARVWRRPVLLLTADERGAERKVTPTSDR